jgi:hypothetical protein
MFRATLAATAAAATVGAISAGLIAASTAQATTPACGNSAIQVSHGAPQGAAGHGIVVLLFKNVSGSTCVLNGYPTLRALNSSGWVIATAAHTLSGYGGGAHVVAPVSIAPNHYASAKAEWLNFNPVTTNACTFSASSIITPATTTLNVHSALSVSVCQLQVHPSVAGISGDDGYQLAKGYWQEGATVPMSQEGLDWQHAANELNTQGATYATQVNQLKQLISLPDANQTPAQNAEWHSDVNALNSFFGTPNLYS